MDVGVSALCLFCIHVVSVFCTMCVSRMHIHNTIFALSMNSINDLSFAQQYKNWAWLGLLQNFAQGKLDFKGLVVEFSSTQNYTCNPRFLSGL